MPQHEKISQFLLLPELKLLKFGRDRSGRKHKQVEKVSSFEICPKCATPSKTVYDRRWAKAHDAPIHGNQVWLHVLKRRFYCKTCRKPFTEPVQGIRKGKRTTERFKRGVLGPVRTLRISVRSEGPMHVQRGRSIRLFMRG
ncbi:MAG: transposase [Bdellovibrionales bacterium]|nr:transposase [Bdellovibrionales bacterium]